MDVITYLGEMPDQTVKLMATTEPLPPSSPVEKAVNQVKKHLVDGIKPNSGFSVVPTQALSQSTMRTTSTLDLESKSTITDE